jgi:hypothetical protein
MSKTEVGTQRRRCTRCCDANLDFTNQLVDAVDETCLHWHKQGADGSTDASHLLLVVAEKVALAGYVTFDGLRLWGHGQL